MAWNVPRETRQTERRPEGRTKVSSRRGYLLGDPALPDEPHLRLIGEALLGPTALPILIYFFLGTRFFAAWGWISLGVAAASLLGDILLHFHIGKWSTRRTWGTVAFVFAILMQLGLWLVVRATAS